MNKNMNKNVINPKGGKNRQEKTEVTFSGNLKFRRTTKTWQDQVEKFKTEEDVDIQLDTKMMNSLWKVIAAMMREGADRIDGGQNPEQNSDGDGDGFEDVQ